MIQTERIGRVPRPCCVSWARWVWSEFSLAWIGMVAVVGSAGGTWRGRHADLHEHSP